MSQMNFNMVEIKKNDKINDQLGGVHVWITTYSVRCLKNDSFFTIYPCFATLPQLRYLLFCSKCVYLDLDFTFHKKN